MNDSILLFMCHGTLNMIPYSFKLLLSFELQVQAASHLQLFWCAEQAVLIYIFLSLLLPHNWEAWKYLTSFDSSVYFFIFYFFSK